MQPKQVQDFLTKAVVTEGHPPVFLLGPPGVGKSSVVWQVVSTVGKTLGDPSRCHGVDIRAALLDPTDLRGIIIPKLGRAVWFPPGFLPPTESDETWIVFFDELNLAPLLVQHACYQAILDKKIGEYKFPVRTFMIAAGNRVDDRAGVREMPSALRNRFCLINFETSIDAWCDWALANDVSAEMVAFLRLNSDLLSKFDPARDLGAFATPRSIVFADRLWKIHEGASYVWEAMEGCTGKEFAAKFSGYLRIYKELPNVDGILEGKIHTVPDRADLRFAVAALVGTKTRVEHLEAAIRYANKLPPEQGTFLVQLIVRKPGMLEPLGTSPAWKEWIKAHREFIV